MEILNEEQILQQQQDVINARLAGIAEEKRLAAEAEKIKQQGVHANLVQDAQNLRAEAAQAPDEKTKLLLLTQAADIQAEANRLAVELGLMKPEELEEKPGVSIPEKAKPFIWLGSIAALLTYLYVKFFGLKDAIDLNNTKVDPFSQVRPYGLDSIQKLTFEKFTLGIDAVSVFILLGVFAPVLLWYFLPFGSKINFQTEFKNELTPWQRIIVSVLLVLGLFLLVGLSHSVKA